MSWRSIYLCLIGILFACGIARADQQLLESEFPQCAYTKKDEDADLTYKSESKRTFLVPQSERDKVALAAAQAMHALGLVIRQYNRKDEIWRIVGRRTGIGLDHSRARKRSEQYSSGGNTLEIKIMMSPTDRNGIEELRIDAKHGFTRLTDQCLYGQVLSELIRQHNRLGQ